ncbi:MAG: ABC transporter ATP-binding protein [Phaeodactylibacter sp.]|nr:ABC transporter ATP-binding protein [Phaeodactylibacter sp.]MCB9264897.1 ABC transporter ATP-binding protein [Lewinellaceae bacterium]MCB9291072.1 ABC transporter ATP-binding protein [Lewinellaceae bacterium]
MRIELDSVGKRYRMEWILRGISLRFEAGKKYAITGPNGSGKSTLLRILSGHLTPSKGKARHFLGNQVLDHTHIYRHLSYAAPYIELIEELTLWEALQFHLRFKPLIRQMDASEVLSLLNLSKARNKAIRDFSSGMKQRLKLALAICSDTSLLLLDEPTTNLDKEGIAWYQNLIRDFSSGRLLIVASNVDVDFDFCEERVDILEYK